MQQRRLDGLAIGYAVRIARRLGFDEEALHRIVDAATDPTHLDDPVDPETDRIFSAARHFQMLVDAGLDLEVALRHMKRKAGRTIDAGVVDTLLALVRDDALAALCAKPAQSATAHACGDYGDGVVLQDVRMVS